VSEGAPRATIQLGVFMPVGNNGWILSRNSPQFMPTYELNRDVTLLAEEIGFHYVFSMAKWRGFGGATRFWDQTVESFTLMAGLAAITKRVRLVVSVAPVLMHPAIVAKMAATLDDMSGGRLALNIVSAGNRAEYTQMGLYPEDFESYRYDYTDEWLEVLKALWTQPSVTYEGKYFSLKDCVSDPKPVQKPYPPIVCATSSERGYEFVAKECEEAFLGGGSVEQMGAASRKMKLMAREHGRSVKTQTLLIVIQGDTDEEARRLVEDYREGADYEAIANVYDPRSRGPASRDPEVLPSRFADPRFLYYRTFAFAGGPERIADLIEDLAVNGQLDGLLLVFPDFIEGLNKFHRDVMPILWARRLLSAT